MWKVNWSTRHTSVGQRKFWENSESLTGSESMTPKHMAGALSTEVWELMCSGRGMGSILTGDSEFSFSLTHVMLINSPFTFQITELKIHHHYSLITTHDDFDSADPSRMQDACHLWTRLNDRALHVASVDRAPTMCSGGHEFDSCWGLRIFSLYPTLLSCWLVDLYQNNRFLALNFYAW